MLRQERLHGLPEIDAAVIGAGVVGLAIARSLARSGRHVVVLEAEERIGTHTSSRNSEVIHAGIYYDPGSLKARLCVEGKQALYRYCAERGVACSRVGKLIVATREDEVPYLERLKMRAEENGVSDLAWLEGREVHDLEPAVACVRALLSPSTGIVDSHGLMTALLTDAKEAGAEIVFRARVTSGTVDAAGLVLEGTSADPFRVHCRTVVNAAGLRAPELARAFEGVPRESVPPSFFAKGHYFSFKGKSPFSRLIYPVPEPGGLGVHVTLDRGGRAKFGPDVEWVEGVDYGFDASRRLKFVAAIRRYCPSLTEQDLEPGYTGIRPKIVGATGPAADFVIQGPEAHGVRGLVNLYGIESPGLTASLAIAEHVRALLGGTPAT